MVKVELCREELACRWVECRDEATLADVDAKGVAAKRDTGSVRSHVDNTVDSKDVLTAAGVELELEDAFDLCVPLRCDSPDDVAFEIEFDTKEAIVDLCGRPFVCHIAIDTAYDVRVSLTISDCVHA